MFFEFVNGMDGYMTWDETSRNLEIWGGSSDAYKNYIDTNVIPNLVKFSEALFALNHKDVPKSSAIIITKIGLLISSRT